MDNTRPVAQWLTHLRIKEVVAGSVIYHMVWDIIKSKHVQGYTDWVMSCNNINSLDYNRYIKRLSLGVWSKSQIQKAILLEPVCKVKRSPPLQPFLGLCVSLHTNIQAGHKATHRIIGNFVEQIYFCQSRVVPI